MRLVGRQNVQSGSSAKNRRHVSVGGMQNVANIASFTMLQGCTATGDGSEKSVAFAIWKTPRF